MKEKRYLVLLCGLALVGSLAGCSRDDAPNVTATPSVSQAPPPSESVSPSETTRPTTTEPADSVEPTDNYHADGDGQVDVD